MPILVAVSVGVSALARPGPTRRSASKATASPPATAQESLAARLALPDRLAYTESGPERVYSRFLFWADGDGSNPHRAPLAVFVAGFAWSPDGVRGAAVDLQGVLHVLPDGTSREGPVRSVAFDPDGETLAICTGASGPSLVSVVSAAAPGRLVWPSVLGCYPEWSADGTYIAYWVPGTGVDLAGGRVEVMNTRLNIQFSIPGRWPVAWNPSSSAIFAPLAVVSREGDSVDVMNQRGLQRRTLISAADLRRAYGGTVPGISLLAWSPDGRWLAMGIPPGARRQGVVTRLTSAAVVVRDPSGGESFVTLVPPGLTGAHQPISLSWSPQGRLLAEFDDQTGDAITYLIDPLTSNTELPVRDASWSPDGHWVLARTAQGWIVIDAETPARTFELRASSRWTAARWCCPPVPVHLLAGWTVPNL